MSKEAESESSNGNSILKFKKVHLPRKINLKEVIPVILFGIILLFFILSSFTGPIIGNGNGNLFLDTGSLGTKEETQDIATIRAVIEAEKAEHLDTERQFISDITNEIKSRDGVWSETISSGEYVRVVFEEPLTSGRDITIYPRVVSGNPRIEVYEAGSNSLIAEFNSLNSNEYNKIFLTNLQGSQDTFDLRVADGSVQFDHIFDPTTWYARDTTNSGLADCTRNRDSSTTAGTLQVTFTMANGDTACFDTSTQNGNVGAGIWTALVDFDRGGAGGPPDPTVDIAIQIVESDGTLVETIASCTGLSVNGNNIEHNCTQEGVAQKSLSNQRIRLKVTASAGGGRLPSLNYDAPDGVGEVGDTKIIIPNIAVDNPPQWFDNQTNSTAAGEAVNHSVRWTDETALANYTFSFDNGAGTFVNDSVVSFTGTTNFSNVIKIVNSTVGSAIRWRVYARDSSGNENVTDIFSYTTTTDTAPQWSNPVVDDSTPNPGQTVIHNVTWTDDTALSYATLEVNSSGVNCDTTANVSNTVLSGTSQVANLSWAVENACEGKTIGWRQYANDSEGQWNVTDLQTYTVNNIAPIASFGVNPVDNFNSSSSTVTFDLKGSDNLGIDTLQLYTNTTGTWQANQTNSSPVNDTFWNVTVSGIAEGRYIWAAWVNDTAGNEAFSSTNRTFTVDLTNPTSVINAPGNDTWTTDTTPDINITMTDNFDSSIFYTIYVNDSINKSGSVTNNTATNVTLDTQPQGLRLIVAEAKDDSGRAVNSTTLYLKIDSIVPQIEFTTGTEANGSSKNQNWIFANVSVTEANFKNITYKLFNDTGLLNETTYTTLVTSINWTNLDNNNVQYWYNVSTYDSVGNFNETETRYITLTADQPPTVTILFPENTTYNVDVTQLNYSATDDNSVSACWYSLDGGVTNSTPDASCGNFSGLTSIEGSNNWTVYANDSIGQEASDVVFFTKDTIFPQFTNFQRSPTTPNEDQPVQLNVTVTETNKDTVILEFNNGTARNYTVTTSNGDEFFFTINTGNYTAHDNVNYSWYANDTAGNLNKSVLQSFTVANQIPTVSAPAINDTTPETNDIISCDGGTFSDNDAEDSEQARFFLWYDNDVEISGQTSQTLDLSTSGLNKGDVIICSVRVYDGFDNSSFVNSSNTATIQNSAPVITNPLTSVSWDANGSTFTYDYGYTDVDGDSETWFDNTTLFDINATGYITDTPTESEAGIYEIQISVSDGEVNATDDFTYTINDVTSPNIQFVSPTEANDSQLTRNYIQVNVTASDTNGIDTITLRLYNSTSLVQENTSTSSPLFVNFTNLPDEFYFFNATVNDTSGNENSTETREVSTDTGAPTVNYVAPTESSGVFRSRNYVEINVTASDPNLDKIEIRLYNSSGSQINSSTTSTSPNFINFTSLADGQYFFNATVNDTFGNENSLATRNVTLDTTNPSITSLTEIPSDPITYVQGATYEFNATITDTNLDVVLIEFDSVNYTATNLVGDIYNLTLTDLAAGTYNYYWYANDSAGNVNITQETYTINNATGDVTLLINGTADNQTGTYSIQTNASASTSFGTVTLLRNGTDVTSENNVFVTLAAGSYNYTAISSGDENHSSASTTLFVTISRAASEVNLTLNGTRGNVTIIQDSTIPINLTTITGDAGATLKLYREGTLINQGTSPLGNQTTFNSVGVFNITGIYNESQNFTGSFETWFVNVTEAPDETNPSITSLTETPSDPATYSQGATYEFNATITDNRNLSTVIIEFDGVNYTPTNLFGDVYNLTLTDLAAGVYSYYWYANDTSGNVNQTATQTYTVDQNTTSLSLTISPSTTVTYGTETTAAGSGCPSQITCNLYRDNVSVTNPETATLATGTYNYTFNTTGNANYTSASNSTNLTINKATGVVFTYVDNERANKTIEQFTAIYLNGTLENGTGTIELYNNGTLINQGSSPLSNLTNFTTIGLFNITTIYDGNENFTSASETWFVEVLEADVTPPNVQVLYPENTSYNAIQTQLNYSASDNFALDTCWYSLDNGQTNTTVICGQNISGLNSGQGSSTWKVYANDTKGLENSSSVTFFIDSINPTISFVSPTEANDSELGRNYIQVNVTPSDPNLDKIEIRLYNSTGSRINSSITSSSPNFINFTNLVAGTYHFNATANDTVGNEVSTATRTVSLVTPTVNITLPENKTYISGTNLPLNFTATNHESFFYNIDSGNNTTIETNGTFNTTQGQHTLNLFANNSVGESSDNIVFTVNTSKFRIVYSNYTGNKRGSSTNFNASSFENIQNLPGVVLEDTDFGKIEFSEAINLTDDSDASDNELNLDANTNISDNFIEINTTALSNFNKSATLYLYNLTFSNPRILRNGEPCSSDICTKISYTSGTLKFNVTQFTNYSSEETPEEETPSTTGGGGGGSGIVPECTEDTECNLDEGEVCLTGKCVKLFDIKIIDFESPVKVSDFFDFTYFIKGFADINDDVKINFWIENSDGKIVTSGSDVIYIGSFEEKTETTKIFLPSSVESGIYEFFVQVTHGSYTVASHRTIEIQVSEGIAIVGLIDTKKVRTYLVLSLILLAFIIAIFILYMERRKIMKGIIIESKWLKRHKMFVLASLLLFVLILIIIFSNLINVLSVVVSEIILWTKRNVIPHIYSIFIVALALILAIMFVQKLHRDKFFERLGERRRKWTALKRLRDIQKRKEEREREKEEQEREKEREKHERERERHEREREKKRLEKGASERRPRILSKVSGFFRNIFGGIDNRLKKIGKRISYIGRNLRAFFREIFKKEEKIAESIGSELRKDSRIVGRKISGLGKDFKGETKKASGLKFNLPQLEVPRFGLRFRFPQLEVPRFNLRKGAKEIEVGLIKGEKSLVKSIIDSEKTIKKDLKKGVEKAEKFKFRIPEIKFEKISFPKISLKKQEAGLEKAAVASGKSIAKGIRKEEETIEKNISKEVRKIEKFKFSLPRLTIPKINFQKIFGKKEQKPEKRKKQKAKGKQKRKESWFKKIRVRLPRPDFSKEKEIITKAEKAVGKEAKETAWIMEKIHKDVSEGLRKTFGKKTWNGLVKDFEKAFSGKNYRKQYKGFMNEVETLRKKAEKGEVIGERKLAKLSEKTDRLLLDLYKNSKKDLRKEASKIRAVEKSVEIKADNEFLDIERKVKKTGNRLRRSIIKKKDEMIMRKFFKKAKAEELIEKIPENKNLKQQPENTDIIEDIVEKEKKKKNLSDI